MQPNEIRVGNCVLKGGDIFIADPVTIMCANNYNPIPLTEEWLVKFGFEKEPLSYSKNIDLFGGGKKISVSGDYLYIIDSEKQTTIPTDIITIWNKDVKKEFYVHQLQNLYFALTGEELSAG